MEREKEQLLELLRSGMWGTVPSASLFEGDNNWSILFRRASEQAVLGIVSTQASQLPKEQLPDKKGMMQLHSLSTLNRKAFSQQLQALQEVTHRLKEAGVTRVVLLKGAGVASNYLDPSLRQCGDVDIYVGEDNFQLACDVARSWSESQCGHSSSNTSKHFDFEFGKTHIEIHRHAISSYNIASHPKEFQEWQKELLNSDNVRKVELDGVELTLPPYNFDAIYIMLHAWSHFCDSGIAFRQLCDWTLYIHKHRESIDIEQLQRDIKRFGLMPMWGHFGNIAVTLLGLNPDSMPLLDGSRNWHTEKVAARIWNGGNFGFYDKNQVTEHDNDVKRKFLRFFFLFRSFRFLASLDVVYAIKLFPRQLWIRTWLNIGIYLKKLS